MRMTIKSPEGLAPEFNSVAEMRGQNVLSASQFTTQAALGLFEMAKRAGEAMDEAELKALAKEWHVRNVLGAVFAFYEKSTRTHDSSLSAANYLGIKNVRDHHGMENTSVGKGESFDDTMRSLQITNRAELLGLRNPEIGSSLRAAQVLDIPVVNLGDGAGEHPTQSLLDLMTIYSRMGTINDLTIAMVGDLKYGRTVHSLAKILAKAGKNNRLIMVSPDRLAFPTEVINELGNRVTIEKVPDFHGILKVPDVWYWTRIQEERFKTDEEKAYYQTIKNFHHLTLADVKKMSKNAILMHPLPKVPGELDDEVDLNKRTAYWEQMMYGLEMRMALFAAILRAK